MKTGNREDPQSQFRQQNKIQLHIKTEERKNKITQKLKKNKHKFAM